MFLTSGYYLSAARRPRGRFFSPIGSGPGGSGLWNGDRDKHWVQLQCYQNVDKKYPECSQNVDKKYPEYS